MGQCSQWMPTFEFKKIVSYSAIIGALLCQYLTSFGADIPITEIRPRFSVMRSLENFRQSISSNWKLDCEGLSIGERWVNRNEAYEYSMPIIEEIVWQGLKRIESINPLFADYLAEQGVDRVLSLKCKNKSSNFGKKSKIEGMVTGAVFVSDPVNNLYWIEHENFFRTIYNYNTLTPVNYPGGPLLREIDFRVATISIFHEFLHFFKADNLNFQIHNEAFNNSLHDVVYSCARVVFPHITIVMRDSKLTDELKLLFDRKILIEDCTTCALARGNHKGIFDFLNKLFMTESEKIKPIMSKISEDPGEIEQAQQLCNEQIWTVPNLN